MCWFRYKMQNSVIFSTNAFMRQSNAGSGQLMFGLCIITPLEMTASILLVFSISSIGFADRIRISACLPGSIVPVWLIKSRASAPFLVAILTTSDVLMPASTNNSSSWCRLFPATSSKFGISVSDRNIFLDHASSLWVARYYSNAVHFEDREYVL